MKTTINNCARCGETHEDLEFEKLDKPFLEGRARYNHWAPCPVNGQPVMLMGSGLDMNKYPEHTKFELVQNEAQIIGPFIDWLRNAKGLTFHKWDEALRDGNKARYGVQAYVPVHTPTREFLAEYYDVDYDAYWAEKDKMLEEFSELQNES